MEKGEADTPLVVSHNWLMAKKDREELGLDSTPRAPA